MRETINHKIKEVILKSGAKLINIDIPNFPIAATSVWVRAGAKNDPTDKGGLAHFFEHLLMTKTKNHPDRTKLLAAIESQGMLFNAFTTRELTYYFYLHEPFNYKTALEFLIDGLNDSQILPDDVEQEKQIILDELNRQQNNPEDLIWEKTLGALFPSHPLGNPLLGDEASIKSITADDIIQFKNKYYLPENFIFITINADVEKISESINGNLRINETKKISKQPDIRIPNLVPLQIIKRDIENTVVGLSYRYKTNNSTEKLIIDIISSCLANSWSSLLINKLRVENKLTYWVESDTTHFQEYSYINIVFSTKPENAPQAIDITIDEIKKITKKELQKVKLNNYKNYIRSSLLREIASPGSLLWWYGYNYLANNEIKTIADRLEDIDKITAKDIQELAARIFVKENQSLNIIGDISEERLKI